MDDHELLRQFEQERSQEAFQELVTRHLGMVYGVARRLVHDAHLAEEVAQNAFTTLAQKAPTLRPPQVIAGWLYHTTRNLSLHAVRGEQRRREREHTAAAMQALQTVPDFSPILEQLESALDQLEPGERDVLLLRFLENRGLREVGVELGVSEDAARMRVNRALESLRGVFGQKGVPVASVLLAATLTSTSAAVVPAGLSASITATVFASVAATAVVGTTTGWLNLKLATAAVAVAAAAGTGGYYAGQQPVERLRAEQQNLMTEMQRLTADRSAALALARSRQADLEKARKDTGELMRLRAEATQLRLQSESLAALRDENQRLRQAPSAMAQPKAPTPTIAGVKLGVMIPKEEVVFAGYATPEAALQSITWAMMSGNYEVLMAAASPEIRAAEEKNPSSRKGFEAGRKKIEALFKGMQILARKTISEDRVELKIFNDYHPGEASSGVSYQPMIRVDGEWKLSGSTRGFPANWNQNPEQIQNYAP
jgi:RNA polymerase sigma factor (sigma-70 family)